MHDTLRLHGAATRSTGSYHHNELTFGLLYAFSRELRPAAVARRGRARQRLAARQDAGRRLAEVRQPARLLRLHVGHPGKKLLFMGGEFGQEREWNHDASLDWHLLDDPAARGRAAPGARPQPRSTARSRRCIELDCEAEGFDWLVADDHDNSVFACPALRREPGDAGRRGRRNFTPVPRARLPHRRAAAGVLPRGVNTDARSTAAAASAMSAACQAEETPGHGQPYSLTLTLPPLATLILERVA